MLLQVSHKPKPHSPFVRMTLAEKVQPLHQLHYKVIAVKKEEYQILQCELKLQNDRELELLKIKEKNKQLEEKNKAKANPEDEIEDRLERRIREMDLRDHDRERMLMGRSDRY